MQDAGSLNGVGSRQNDDRNAASSGEGLYYQAQFGSLQSEQTLAEVELPYDISGFIPNNRGLDLRQDSYDVSCDPTYQIGNDFRYHKIFGIADPSFESQTESQQFLSHGSANNAMALTDAFDTCTRPWELSEINPSNSFSLDFPLSDDFNDPTLSIVPWDFPSEPPLADRGSFTMPQGMHTDWISSLANGYRSSEASQVPSTPSDRWSLTPCL